MNNNQEEAHFYFVLNDFSELVTTYGTKFVFKELRKIRADRRRHQVSGMAGSSVSVTGQDRLSGDSELLGSTF